jgi:hypothetical protein
MVAGHGSSGSSMTGDSTRAFSDGTNSFASARSVARVGCWCELVCGLTIGAVKSGFFRMSRNDRSPPRGAASSSLAGHPPNRT